VREAISQTRFLARGLSPVVVESEGLMSALQELADYTERMFRVACGFVCENPVLVHDHAAATHLYRIAQEAISNAIRHGKARRIEIHLKASEKRITLLVKDHGIGLPPAASPASNRAPAPRGLGLRIMQYRAGIIGGSLAIQHDPDGGTSVVCSVHTAPTPASPIPAAPAASP
jgi:signal transduction histidine kinase